MAAALMALAVFFAPGGQPAQAQQSTVWSATLTVQVSAQNRGCSGGFSPGSFCSTALTDSDFTYEGVDYQIEEVRVNSSGTLIFELNKTIPDSLRSAATLRIGNTAFVLASGTFVTIDVTNDRLAWLNSGLSWSAGDTVTVTLTEGSATTPTETTPTEPTRPQTFPTLDRLPVDESVERYSTTQRYCYLAEGNSTTEYVRYPDGRTREVPRVNEFIRAAYACK